MPLKPPASRRPALHLVDGIETWARDATACTEFPQNKRRVVHVSPYLALALMALGAGAGGYGLYALVDALFRFLAGVP